MNLRSIASLACTPTLACALAAPEQREFMPFKGMAFGETSAQPVQCQSLQASRGTGPTVRDVGRRNHRQRREKVTE